MNNCLLVKDAFIIEVSCFHHEASGSKPSANIVNIVLDDGEDVHKLNFRMVADLYPEPANESMLNNLRMLNEAMVNEVPVDVIAVEQFADKVAGIVIAPAGKDYESFDGSEDVIYNPIYWNFD